MLKGLEGEDRVIAILIIGVILVILAIITGCVVVELDQSEVAQILEAAE